MERSCPPSSAAVGKRHRRRAHMRPPPAPAHIDVARSVRRAATASRANHRPPAERSHQGPSPARTPASHSSRAHPISGCVLPPYCSGLRCKPSHGPPSTIRLENEITTSTNTKTGQTSTRTVPSRPLLATISVLESPQSKHLNSLLSASHSFPPDSCSLFQNTAVIPLLSV